MKAQSTNDNQSTDFYFLDDTDSDGVFLNPDINITRLDNYDFINVRSQVYTDWDISDAYSWN